MAGPRSNLLPPGLGSATFTEPGSSFVRLSESLRCLINLTNRSSYISSQYSCNYDSEAELETLN